MRKGRAIFVAGLLIVIACLVAAALDAFVKPFINPDLGDVVLFIFIMAGAASGFVAGYGLQKVMSEKATGRAK